MAAPSFGQAAVERRSVEVGFDQLTGARFRTPHRLLHRRPKKCP
jgi:hypothetical protein